jgi:hypothetical protein
MINKNKKGFLLIVFFFKKKVIPVKIVLILVQLDSIRIPDFLTKMNFHQR